MSGVWTRSGHGSGKRTGIHSPQGRDSLPGRFSPLTMMIHPSCLSAPQHKPPVVLRTRSHELFESIQGISLNLLCLKIALLQALTSAKWASDLGVLLAYMGCRLILEPKWQHASTKPLVCTVHVNIQLPLSLSLCVPSTLSFSFSSPQILACIENCGRPWSVKTTITLWFWYNQPFTGLLCQYWIIYMILWVLKSKNSHSAWLC